MAYYRTEIMLMKILVFLSLTLTCSNAFSVDIAVGGTGSRNEALLDAVKAIASKEYGARVRVQERQMLNYTRNPITLERDVCSAVSDGQTPLAIVLSDEATPLALTSSPESTLDTVGELFQIPILVTGDVVRETPVQMPFSTSTGPAVYNIRPNFISAVRDLIRRYNWREMLYLFDSPQGLKRARQLQHLLHALDGRHRTRIYFYALSTTDDRPLHYELRTIDRWRTSNRPIIGAQTTPPQTTQSKTPAPPVPTDVLQPEAVLRAVVDLSSERKFDAFLSELKDMGMNRASYHWMLYTANANGLDLRGFEKGGCNITGFRLASLEPGEQGAIPNSWLDELQSRGLVSPSPTFNNAKRQVDKQEGLQSNFQMSLDNQLLFDALMTVTKVASTAQRASSPVSATPYSCPSAGQRFVNLTSFYNAVKTIRPPSQLRGLTGNINFEETGARHNTSMRVLGVSYLQPLREIGTWTQAEGLYHFFIPAPNITMITPNKTIRVVSIIDVPFLRNKTMTDGKVHYGNDRFEGFCADLAEKVFKMLGLQYEIHLVRDGLYGAEVNGTWNGMIGEILDGTADVAIAALTISSQRERVVAFSKPFLQTGISIMIKKPEKQKPGVFSFMDPLSTSIWMCIIFAYAGVSLALFLVSRFSPYEWRSMIFAPQATLQNTMWGTLGAIMQQGGNLTPHSFSGRLVASVWWFFCLILISSYTANLAAFLTIERTVVPIDSAEDLVKQSEIQYGTVASGATQDYFRNTKIETHKKMWNFMEKAQPSVFVQKIEDGVDRVLKSKGKYAFLLESLMNEYYFRRKPCNTQRVGDDLDSKGYGIATQLYSDLKDDLNDAVLKLTESGDIQELHKKWWIDKGECPQEKSSKDSSQSPLTLSNVAGVFYILITGLLCSMLSAGLEFIWNAHVHAHKFRIPFRTAMRVQARFATHGLYLMCESALSPSGLLGAEEELLNFDSTRKDGLLNQSDFGFSSSDNKDRCNRDRNEWTNAVQASPQSSGDHTAV